jgi:hypothetical protein
VRIILEVLGVRSCGRRMKSRLFLIVHALMQTLYAIGLTEINKRSRVPTTTRTRGDRQQHQPEQQIMIVESRTSR